MGAVTSIRGNSMPTGGPTATQSVQPVGQLTPQDIAALVDQLIPAVQKFRANSTVQNVTINDMAWAAQGDSIDKQISAVGLGLRTRSWHHMDISITNAATAAETFTPSPDFPFNLIKNTQIGINGGANVYSCSGARGLEVAGRRYRGFFNMDAGEGGCGPKHRWCQILCGSNLTKTNADTGGLPYQLSGIKSISVAGSATGVLTVDFYTEEWFVLDMESMLGALPLQNNSTYATIQRTLQAAFLSTSTTDTTFPLYHAGADLSVSAFSGTTKTFYDFASVPSDPSLYTAIVSNSYQVTEQPNILGAAGASGIQYNIPQNQYLVSLHSHTVDGNGTPVMFTDGVLGSQTAEFTNYASAAYGTNKRVIQYNGGKVIPVLQFPYRDHCHQFEAYGDDRARQLAGYMLWDGEDTSNDIQAATDNMNWIDCYNVASPQDIIDVGASVFGTTKTTYVRESVVAGSVQVVGG